MLVCLLLWGGRGRGEGEGGLLLGLCMCGSGVTGWLPSEGQVQELYLLFCVLLWGRQGGGRHGGGGGAVGRSKMVNGVSARVSLKYYFL